MMVHLPFSIVLWSVMIVSAGQGILLTHFLLRPRLYRILHCSWCWRDCGIISEYPPPWSSSICHHHDLQIRIQARERRRAREHAAAAVEQAGLVLQPQEEVQV